MKMQYYILLTEMQKKIVVFTNNLFTCIYIIFLTNYLIMYHHSNYRIKANSTFNKLFSPFHGND